LRASLVKGDTLADAARAIELGDYLNLGSGELKSGGFRRDSILADALEALLAAVYLDSDFATCRALIRRLFGQQLAALPAADQLKDPKTRLQEALQARQQALPVYDVLAVSGEPHDQKFTVRCTIDNGLVTVAEGASRRKAEQEAARQALRQL
jgi:ribonuclease-3